jgi:hypothetical protein
VGSACFNGLRGVALAVPFTAQVQGSYRKLAAIGKPRLRRNARRGGSGRNTLQKLGKAMAGFSVCIDYTGQLV